MTIAIPDTPENRERLFALCPRVADELEILLNDGMAELVLINGKPGARITDKGMLYCQKKVN